MKRSNNVKNQGRINQVSGGNKARGYSNLSRDNKVSRYSKASGGNKVSGYSRVSGGNKVSGYSKASRGNKVSRQKQASNGKQRSKLNLNSHFIIALIVLIFGFIFGAYIYTNLTDSAKIVKKYYEYINEKKYAEAYQLVETTLTEEEFINRVKNIYEGIDAHDINITIISNTSKLKDAESNNLNESSEKNANADTTNSNENTTNSSGNPTTNSSDNSTTNESKNKNENKNNQKQSNDMIEINSDSVMYMLSMATAAGEVDFTNTVKISGRGIDSKILWSDSTIYPTLTSDEKVRIRTLLSKRGEIYDRNDNYLAKNRTAYSVGIVPGKLESSASINTIANLLGMSSESVNNLMQADYVTSETFVALRKISKDNSELKIKLLNIPGVMLNEVSIRVYPYNEATSILTGYVQDNEGKSGLEYAYDSSLKGESGCEIYIDRNGKNVETILLKDAVNGTDLKTTIDANQQVKIYEQYKSEPGCVVKMNYNTGELLALVSTPSYDANDLCLGVTDDEWKKLSEDEDKPLYNRYLASFAPGSSIKPVIGAIGLMTNSFTVTENFGKSGTRWQPDSSWQNLYITTLHTYSGDANLKNALIHSDNIYFAKAALKIGKDNLKEWLERLGFGEKIELKQDVTVSTYGKLSTDAEVANSGYGQAEMMINPIHMASIYSAFATGGTMMQPYIEYSNGEEKKYKEEIVTKNIADTIKEDLILVVEEGTAQACKIEGKTIAGKTGTAEVKKSQTDTEGSEIGWFDAFDESGNLIIAMQQNVKNAGGSGAVVKKVKSMFEEEITSKKFT